MRERSLRSRDSEETQLIYLRLCQRRMQPQRRYTFQPNRDVVEAKIARRKLLSGCDFSRTSVGSRTTFAVVPRELLSLTDWYSFRRDVTMATLGMV